MDHAAIDADLAVFGEEIVDRDGTHLRHYFRRFVGADRLDGFQVMHGRRVEAGLDHGRHVPDLFIEAFRESAGLIVHVPVKRVGDDQALGCLGAERVGVGDLLQQCDHLLAALGDAEFASLLQRIGGVAAGVGQRHNLCL